MKLHVCGPRGSFPTFGKEYEIYGRDTSCYIIEDGDYALVLDCGSGLVNASDMLKRCSKIDFLISHIHYDHAMGLFETRDVMIDGKVNFYGQFDAWSSVEADSIFHIRDFIQSEIHSIEHGKYYELSNGFRVRFMPSNHGDDTSMIDIFKDDKHICYTGDFEYEPDSSIKDWCRGCDLLLFDGSYIKEDYPLYKGWGHSPWTVGCEIAKDCGIKQLIISHHAPQYNDEVLATQEALSKNIFPNTHFARQGADYDI